MKTGLTEGNYSQTTQRVRVFSDLLPVRMQNEGRERTLKDLLTFLGGLYSVIESGYSTFGAGFYLVMLLVWVPITILSGNCTPSLVKDRVVLLSLILVDLTSIIGLDFGTGLLAKDFSQMDRRVGLPEILDAVITLSIQPILTRSVSLSRMDVVLGVTVSSKIKPV